ncbi:hypothetical protein NE236_11330 [Actinoallomurus purpureus]|uniref:hypothetical protein n=1 Tax=Actinoallomurus purpureus TaxID=478114 RepID=UPI00209374B0|nr:hypothetical protein [Actinoallomurus purpureus]MCO6005572.1 hypothetical protein [Actinoallomurus purpureus]
MTRHDHGGAQVSAAMDRARRVADAVLYEGYLLYPYRASAAKNRVRWQFGVLVPPGYLATAEPSTSVTECLLTAAPAAELRVLARFLHLRTRTVEQAEGGGFHPVTGLTVDGTTHLTYEDAAEREAEAVLRLEDVLEAERTIGIGVPGEWSTEPIEDSRGESRGRVVLEHLSLRAALRVRAERLPGPYGLTRLRVTVANTHGWADASAPREHALRRSLLATHLIIGVSDGAFVSLIDPPEWASAAAAGCRNQHTWPVLAGEPGEHDVVLSSPIILYDHPAIAPESPGQLFDSTEIDELLSLRTLTLTDQEKDEARATDPRAAELIERVGDLPPEFLERLHGAIRQFGEPERPSGRTGDSKPTSDPEPRTDPADGPGPRIDQADASEPRAGRAGGSAGSPVGEAVPWWDPGMDRDVSPETDGVLVSGVRVARGSRVRLRPGRRRADAHDMFLAGRTALVEAVFHDVDGLRYVAVTLEDDPGADLARAQGRFHYFAPDEVEPLPGEAGSGGGS